MSPARDRTATLISYKTGMNTSPRIDAGALRAEIEGSVVDVEDRGWDEARQAWNLVADQRPALVVQPANAEDVAATVRFASAAGLRVAPQCVGHGAACLGDLDGVILLRTTGMTDVSIDPDKRTATVSAGAAWRDVIGPAAEHGLVGLHGMSAGVGVTGYALGGGIGWLSRLHGFASTHINSLEVVTADGQPRRVDADSEPELFWALRGGGGGPAVVTSMEIALFELREAFAGALMWPIQAAGEIVHGYREWTLTAPDEVTSTIRLLRFPPLPEIPDPLRGRELAAITLAFTGSEAEGNELVAPLRALGRPYLDTLATIPAPGLGEISGDPQDPVPAIGNGLLLEQFTGETADAYLELGGPDAHPPFVALEIRHLGGALRSTTPDPGAAGPLTSEALVFATGVRVDLDAGRRLNDAHDALRDRMSPWIGARGSLLTFDERSRSLRGAFTAPVADRLAAVTRSHDPDGLFVANHVAD
ncbi:MAG TPA: FAD-binding oxidoreductase [Solirubrobacteraceae bacterium]